MNEPCYQFEHDEDGRLLRRKGWFGFKINQSIPRCGEWDTRYQYKDVDCRIKFERVISVKWAENSVGEVKLYVDYTVQVNDLDFNANAKPNDDKPKLELVK